MSQVEAKNFENVLNSKLNELKSIFEQHIELQKQKDLMTDREVKKLKALLVTKKWALRKSEEENEKLTAELGNYKKNQIFKLAAIIAQKNEVVTTLNQDLIEKERSLTLAKDRLQICDRRYDNMRIELSGYLTRLHDVKNKLKISENEAMQYLVMHTRTKKMLIKSEKELNYLKEKCLLQEEFIQTLLSTLKQHGIRDFESEEEVENENSTADAEQACDHEEEREEDKSEMVVDNSPPLRCFPNWRPSPKLSTILEVDESACYEENDKGDNTTIETSPQITPVKVIVQSEADDSGIFSEPPIESSNASVISEPKKWRRSKKSVKRQKKEKIAEELPKPKIKRHYSKIFSIGCF